MTMTLTVSSTTPTLLFVDTNPGERDFKFVLDNLDFRMEGQAGASWDEVLSYDQTDNAWYMQDRFLVENAGATPTVDLWTNSSGDGWRFNLSGGYLQLAYMYLGLNHCVRIKDTGEFFLWNDGTYQTEFFSHGTMVFKEASTSVDVVQFFHAGTKKAGIGNGGTGVFSVVKCGGTSTAPTDTGRYLGEIRLEYGSGSATIWAWVQTGASTQGWRGAVLS